MTITKRKSAAVSVITILIFLAAGLSGNFVSASLQKRVEKRYGIFAANRFRALNELVERLQDANISVKLEEVNAFWNGVRFSDDEKVWGVSDYWATPWEFLAKDAGDCEDYVIAKYFTLKYLGVSTAKMYFTYVRALKYDKPHMVLTYFEKPGAVPLILDNINYKIFPADKREDLLPVYNFNGDVLSSYSGMSGKISEGKNLKVKKRWDKLMENIAKGKI